jgi:hypothetical protein
MRVESCCRAVEHSRRAMPSTTSNYSASALATRLSIGDHIVGGRALFPGWQASRLLENDSRCSWG